MSRFTVRKRRGGFTLIEIMIVVLIIGILLAIAIPNFMKARESSRTKACIANLKQIEAAKEQWAMDTKAAAGVAVVESDIIGPLLYIKVKPTCPSGNTDYTINALDTAPACGGAVVGHVLP